jgi:hypothetical protein
MIDKISRAWRIPVAALAKPYGLAPSERARKHALKDSKQPA